MRPSLLLLALLSAGLLPGQTNRFDVLITGAKVVDGTGGPWFYGDVGIRGDSIAALGLLSNASGKA